MAKSMLMTLPAILLLMDWWPLKRFDATRPAEPATASSPRRPEQNKDAPTKNRTETAAAERPARAGIASHPAARHGKNPAGDPVDCRRRGCACHAAEKKPVLSLTQLSLADRVGNALVSCVLYLWKAIWPTGLSVFYPLQPWPPRPSWAALFLPGVAPGGRRRFPYLAPAGSGISTLLPVIRSRQAGGCGHGGLVTPTFPDRPAVALAWGPSMSARLRHAAVLPTAASAGCVHDRHARPDRPLARQPYALHPRAGRHGIPARSRSGGSRRNPGTSKAIAASTALRVRPLQRQGVALQTGEAGRGFPKHTMALALNPDYAQAACANGYLAQTGDADAPYLASGRSQTPTEGVPARRGDPEGQDGRGLSTSCRPISGNRPTRSCTTTSAASTFTRADSSGISKPSGWRLMLEGHNNLENAR